MFQKRRSEVCLEPKIARPLDAHFNMLARRLPATFELRGDIFHFNFIHGPNSVLVMGSSADGEHIFSDGPLIVSVTLGMPVSLIRIAQGRKSPCLNVSLMQRSCMRHGAANSASTIMIISSALSATTLGAR